MQTKQRAKPKATVVAFVPRTTPTRASDTAREQRITAIVQMLAVAHQVVRRQMAEERAHAA